MNLEDLKGALTTMADEVQGIDALSRLDQLQEKVQANRRRKVVGVVAAAVCLLAAGVAAPFVAWTFNAPVQPAQQLGNLRTVTDGGYRFYRDPAGNELLGHVVGAPGATSVTLTVAPRSLNLGWVQVCDASLHSLLGAAHVALTVDGHPIPNRLLRSPEQSYYGLVASPNHDCDLTNGALQTQRVLAVGSEANAAAWRNLGVRAGVPATFRLSLRGHVERGRESELRLGLAIYERPKNMVHSHGLWVDRAIVDPEQAGGAYRLVAHRFFTATPESARIVDGLPDADHELYVRFVLVKGVRHGVAFAHQGAMSSDGQPLGGMYATFKPGFAMDEASAFVDPGADSVWAGMKVPTGASGLVAVLVYERFG